MSLIALPPVLVRAADQIPPKRISKFGTSCSFVRTGFTSTIGPNRDPKLRNLLFRNLVGGPYEVCGEGFDTVPPQFSRFWLFSWGVRPLGFVCLWRCFCRQEHPCSRSENLAGRPGRVLVQFEPEIGLSNSGLVYGRATGR